MFVFYFLYRGAYSLGSTHLPWRIFVLITEFLASISVVFVVFMRLVRPWNEEFINQDDGIAGEAGRKQQGFFREDSLWTPSKTAAAVGHGYDASDFEPSDWEEEEKHLEKYGRRSSLSRRYSVQSRPKPKVVKPYTIRVVIPCYKEELSIVRETVMAAVKIKHAEGFLHVYLCDDGEDPLKAGWVEKLRVSGYPNVHYVTRPGKFKGHGKAGNINHCLARIIYRRQQKIDKRELIAVFDADMVAAPEFSERLVPYFEADKKVVMVQSPQTFSNVSMDSDFFDAHNMNFFQYMLPAMDSWNTTTCCGTNFIVGARALRKVNWFPTLSITEDMYLAIQLLSRKGVIKYHSENLVVGEAPLDMRQIFQQRSRWAKGTIQIAIKDNPLWNTNLSMIQRFSFFNACWSYLTSAFMNPLFVLINSIAICFGIFPVTDLDFRTAMAFVAYYFLFYTMIHFTPNPSKHYISLWVVGKMGHFFSFLALKAIFNVLKAEWGEKKLSFKVTEKMALPGNMDVDLNLQDEKEEVYYDPFFDGSDDEDHESEYMVEDLPELDEEVTKDVEAARDSTHKDIRFHWFMTTMIVFVFFYGFWVINDGFAFLPDIKDERTFAQKKGIRLFCMCWMLQFFIAYSLPLWYAYLPNRVGVQKFALKALSTFDTVFSFFLILLTVMLFKFQWIKAVPDINYIEKFNPSTVPLWLNDASSIGGVDNYAFDIAVNNSIPVVVVNLRPTRSFGLYGDDGVSDDFKEYESHLGKIASNLASVDFPVVVVLEPGLMREIMALTYTPETTAYDRVAYQIENNGTAYLDWHPMLYYRYMDMFAEFSQKLHPLTRTYISVEDPFFLTTTLFEPLKLVSDSIKDTTLRGVIINAGSYYSSEDVEIVGEKAFKDYGLTWAQDSSRNGGEWSEGEWADIESCRFDPPGIYYGYHPTWAEYAGGEATEPGTDGRFWVSRVGFADGRLYPAGEEHTCLEEHNIKCSNTCPEQHEYAFSITCLCD